MAGKKRVSQRWQHNKAYCVGSAICTGPVAYHGVAHAGALLLCGCVALLATQQVLPASPELLLADAAGLPHQLLKQGVQVPDTHNQADL